MHFEASTSFLAADMLLLVFEQDMTICEWNDEASIVSWFINCTRAWHRHKYRLISINQQTNNILQFHLPELKRRCLGCWSLSPSKPYYVILLKTPTAETTFISVTMVKTKLLVQVYFVNKKKFLLYYSNASNPQLRLNVQHSVI